jgi:hypothetical protein
LESSPKRLAWFDKASKSSKLTPNIFNLTSTVVVN